MNKPKFFCGLIVAIAFMATLAATLSVPKPIGSDFFWHLNISTMIANGNPAQAVNYLLSPAGNSFPYGFYLSVFHWMLVPLVLSGNPFFFAKILQVLFLPCTLALTIWLVYRYASPKAAVYSGMALLASWAFFDGALIVRPESLDLLFYPLIVASLMATQKKRFLGLALATVYNHGLAAISNIYGFVFKKIREATWQRTLVLAMLGAAPVIAISVFYVSGAFLKWGGAGATENPQEVLFWSDPIGFIPYYMGATILGIPFLFRKGKSTFETLVLWGFVGNLLMLPFWADRWCHYASLPLAMFTGIGITKLQPTWRMIFALTLLTILIVYVASYFAFSFGVIGHWWQPGD